jgi:hypothetical protein
MEFAIQSLKNSAAAGLTFGEAAPLCGISASYARMMYFAHDIKFKRKPWTQQNPRAPRAVSERDLTILALFDERKTLEFIAAKSGITRERVRQICLKNARKPRRIEIGERRNERLEV